MIGIVVTLILILIMSLKHESFDQRNTLAKDKYQLSGKDNNETV